MSARIDKFDIGFIPQGEDGMRPLVRVAIEATVKPDRVWAAYSPQDRARLADAMAAAIAAYIETMV